MPATKKEHPVEKITLHPRNLHRERYDFELLTAKCAELSKYVKKNAFEDASIDFSNPKAVKWLNKALLKTYYDIDYWDIPTDYLCPPIPGRADYIHQVADLLATSNLGVVPKGHRIKCMDIGVGASCVFPIVGNKSYGWSFVGSDIDPQALESARKIISYNPLLKRNVLLRFQENAKDIFHGVMKRDEFIDVSICNPPFHSSLAEAEAGTLRKLSSLNHKKVSTPVLNFGGQTTELWCEGGEERFVRDMIRQSKQFSTTCFWFTTLISKKDHLKAIYSALQAAGALQVKTIPMVQGTKSTRIVAWTFFTPEQQETWRKMRWER